MFEIRFKVFYSIKVNNFMFGLEKRTSIFFVSL